MKLAVVVVALTSALPAVSWAFAPSTRASPRLCFVSCKAKEASSKEEDLALTIDVIMASMNIGTIDEEEVSVAPVALEKDTEESPESTILTEDDDDEDAAEVIESAIVTEAEEAEIESILDTAADESPPVLSKEELSSLTVLQLKEKLRASGLRVSGKKAELIERLLNGP